MRKLLSFLFALAALAFAALSSPCDAQMFLTGAGKKPSARGQFWR
jgi:hypothetical protein